MPETDDLDRLFDSLTHDIATRAGRPGAEAAMATATRRRRTTLVAVAATAAVAVGGLALPQLTIGDRPEWLGGGLPTAPLDAAAMEQATDGWIDGWTDDDTYGGGSFSGPECEHSPDTPFDAATSGRSLLTAPEGSARFLAWGFDDPRGLQRAWEAYDETLAGCPAFTRTPLDLDLPDGTLVSHFRVEPTGSGSRVSDIWVASTGTGLGYLETVTTSGSAPDEVADDVAEALLAGVRDGWAEELQGVDDSQAPALRPQLPSYDERDLTAALDGWQAAGRVDAEQLPTTPCLSFPTGDQAGSPTGEVAGSSTSASPTGRFVSVVGFRDPGTQAADHVASTLEQLRGCQSTRTTERTLADGVVLVTYDRGGEAGHGAVWLAANEDRAMVVAVDGADRALPADAAPAVAGWLTDVLALPWPTAS